MATSDASVLTPIDQGDGPLTEDLLYEVLDGQEVAKPAMSVYAISTASILYAEFYLYLRQADLGRAIMEALFQFDPQKRRLRRPDVAFVSYERWGRDQDLTSGNGWDVIPDLVVEVMDKILEYLDAGVVQVWVVYPNVRQVLIYSKGNGFQVVGPDGALDGGALLPGFRLALTDLFRNKAKS